MISMFLKVQIKNKMKTNYLNYRKQDIMSTALLLELQILSRKPLPLNHPLQIAAYKCTILYDI